MVLGHARDRGLEVLVSQGWEWMTLPQFRQIRSRGRSVLATIGAAERPNHAASAYQLVSFSNLISGVRGRSAGIATVIVVGG